MSNKIYLSEVMMPSQTNPNGNVHGGELMKMMDSTAYAAARKYSRSNVVTARVDELEFHTPILIGDLVTCTAEVIYVGHTSMEVAVNVEVEVLEADQGPQHALSAYFTMVALDRNGRPMAVPPLELETEEEKAAFEAAKKRHELYHQRKKQREEASARVIGK
ncbi:acyl-CoA thioesterase [Selenomonas ruminantium]|uniref:Acyl-CoA hydrolase n=1 Tax=Selenomonas ruminantium TaxID=971 RepID=A0A1H0V5J0_SELRU|nr:acyl-CoA thioesterase [Selenomonas ruminantium]SDP73799.1 Acyl-CoA hydrolase [Selenomonas ruminantium]